MVYKCFHKKYEGSGIVNNKQNIQLAEELHKQLLETLKKE